MNNLSRKVLKDQSENLDIVERKNGDLVFFVLDLSQPANDPIEYLRTIISENNINFAIAGMSFNWCINEDHQFKIIHNKRFERNLNHKFIVKPCRLYHRDCIAVYAVKLYYYPYMSTKITYHYSDNCSYRSMYVNKFKLLSDFQKYMICNHADLIKENSIWIIKKFNNEMDQYYNDKSYCEEISEDDKIPDESWRIVELEKLMQELIRKNKKIVLVKEKQNKEKKKIFDLEDA